MTMTMTAVDDSDSPVMLDTKDIAEIFKRCSLAVYAEARRKFYREVNLNPFKSYSEGLMRFLEWMFWDWFAYDCAVSSDISDDESENMRMLLQPDSVDGVSPFRSMSEYLYETDPRIGDREIHDLREVDETNFTSIFWIHDANAAQGRMVLEDVIHGGRYQVFGGESVAKYDGAHGGMIANRIARVRGVWRFCAIPIYEARQPDGPEVGEAIAQSFRDTGYRPDFPGLVRFYYGRAKDTGLDWEDMELARKNGTLRAIMERARS